MEGGPLAYPVPGDEGKRLEQVARVTDTVRTREDQLQDLVDAARHALDAPMAALTVVGEDEQHLYVSHGIDFDHTSREDSICAHAIADDTALVVPDAHEDARFSGLPCVTDDPGVRFYAGAPIRLGGHSGVGTLCVMDENPRSVTPRAKRLLESLAEHVARLLDEDEAQADASARFADFVSHELSRPLADLSESLDLLEASVGLDLGPEVRDTLRTARRQADHVDSLVDALVDLAHDRQHEGFAPVDLDAVVDDVAEQLVTGSNLTIQAGELPTVRGHPGLLRQLCYNLVTLAVERSQGDPTVEFSAQRTDTGWLLTVDTPVEAPEDPGSVDREGLALCERIVEHHGGEAWIDDADDAWLAFTLAESARLEA